MTRPEPSTSLTRQPIDALPILVSHGFQADYERGFANGLAANGVQVCLVSSDTTDYARLSPLVRTVNLRRSQDRNRRSWTKVVNLLWYHFKLLGLALRRESRLVHVVGVIEPVLLCGIVEGLWFRAFVRRYVLTVHDLIPHDRHSRWQKLLARLAYKLPHALVVHTRRMRDELVCDYGVPFAKVTVMEHGLEPAADEAGRRPDAEPDDELFKILFFGAIAHYKGVDLLLHALEQFKVPFSLTIAGHCLNAQLAGDIRARIARHPFAASISWQNRFVPEAEIADLFGRADALVLPYRHIDQSGVLFQAMRFGVPVVATRVGAFADYITADFGELCAADALGLHDGLVRLHGRLHEFSRSAIAEAGRKFDWSNTARAVLGVYAERRLSPPQSPPSAELFQVHTVAVAKPIRVAVVTNIPAPYRVPIFNLLAQDADIDLHVFYSASTEPDRKWDLPALTHTHTFLQERYITRNGRFIHNNIDVVGALRRFAPDVVVTTGFNPTHLYAFGYARFFARQHVPMTDGTLVSEAGLSLVHRTVRRLVLRRSRAFVVASLGGRALFQSYGADSARIYASPLCANTAVPWAGVQPCAPGLDFLFSGRLVGIKNPFFALQVAQGVARRLGRRVSLGVMGSGLLDSELRFEAAKVSDDVELRMAGHVSQAAVPAWFASAHVFLFPTSWDPWGVVANEACMVGLPVIVSPHAGVAGELIRDGVNGYVRPLDLDLWVEAAAELLSDDELHARMSLAAREQVVPYSFENAAKGIADASRRAIRRGGNEAPRDERRRRRVVCIQRRLTHYRVPLFEALRQRLAADGVDFDLVHGEAAASEQSKRDEGHIAWANRLPNRYLLGERLCWQNARPMTRGADLVIVAHENKLVFNMLAATIWRPKRLAFWGHGRNFQSTSPRGVKESIKRSTIGNADWWFVYTNLSRKVVEAEGFPRRRVTDLENAVDTTKLFDQCAAVTPEQVSQFRASWSLGDGSCAIFVGSLYAEKRLDFLLEAAAGLARRVSGFHLLVIGDGPQRKLMEDACQQSAWLRYLGPRFGVEKAVALRAASVMLNPGLVGLGVLDAFAAGLPMVTTQGGLHSPEIAYLRSGENGLCTDDDVASYVDTCSTLLHDKAAMSRMARVALQDAAHYTLDNMVENFRLGILQALKVPAR